MTQKLSTPSNKTDAALDDGAGAAPQLPASAPPSEVLPHYSGHRARLRARFLKQGAEALAEYELLELVLFAASARADVKPLAKRLLKQFGSYAGVVRAEVSALRQVEGLGDAGIAAIKAIESSVAAILKQEITSRPVIQSWTALVDYCKVHVGAKTREEFHALFLNTRKMVIAHHKLQEGTVDQTMIFPRELIRMALEVGASHMILVHNHPSGDPTPSRADIDITRQIRQAASAFNISVLDHLIITRGEYVSFKAMGLMEGL